MRLPALSCFAMVVMTFSAFAGCNHRKLPPELNYSQENVELFRKSLGMPESTESQAQVEQANAEGDGTGDTSADSEED